MAFGVFVGIPFDGAVCLRFCFLIASNPLHEGNGW